MASMSCFRIILSMFLSMKIFMMPSDNSFRFDDTMLEKYATCRAQGWDGSICEHMHSAESILVKKIIF